jgi:predicted MFS family arabinose efflux permease
VNQQTDARAHLGISEGRLLFLVSAVQFVNILDFMIVMPLGPDFAKALGISISKLGLIGGSYTAAAAVSGLVSSHFLDRFDRRSALAVAMLGLVLGTACGGLATGLPTLMLARIVAGCFGGPATSLALSIIADVIPPLRRGRALGLVMASFSVASVFGVPAGLELARWGGWRLPFFAVAALGVVVATSAIFLMPSLRLHLGQAQPTQRAALGVFLREPIVLLALGATFTVMMASFSVIPNLSAYIQHNLGYPRSGLGVLYLVGGSVSFLAMQVVGRFVDRLGAGFMGGMGTLLFVLVLTLMFVVQVPWFPVMGFFVAFMTSMAFRGVSLNALSSRVPAPHERARFMSLQSAVQHLASSSGAISSSIFLHELPDHRLQGMSTVAGISIVLGLALPMLLAAVERRVQVRERAAHEAANPAQP